MTATDKDFRTFIVSGPRECSTCGWKLPDEITGYVGGCPVCLLRMSGYSVVKTASLKAVLELVAPAPTVRDGITITCGYSDPQGMLRIMCEKIREMLP